MRVVSSCSTCRTRKKRCIASSSDTACKFCLSKSLRCDAPFVRKLSDITTYSLRPVPATISPSDTSQPPDNSSVSPESTHLAAQSESTLDIVQATLDDRTLCEELINIYFKVIHSKQHILFHHASFLDDHTKGLVPRFILLGIIALSARFFSHPSFEGINPWLRGKPFFEEGIRWFDRRKKLISIEAIQGSVLLGFYAFTDGDTARDDLLSCQAVRMSQTLGIPTILNGNGLKREIEINVYWQTWMMDRWSSVRSDWPLQLRNDTNLPRPLRQEFFDLLTPESTPCDLSSSNELRESSMWGLILPLTQWHAEVVKLNFQIATEASLGHEIHDVVQDLSTQLSNWAQSLPFHLRDTPQNFRDYSSRGYGRLFSVMHIIYHNTCQSLFYQFLAKSVSRERGVTADHMVLTCAELCRSHAVSLSKLYWELNTASDLDCLWSPVNSHLLVIASTIHLHTMLLQPDKVEATEAKQLLERNFIILQELQKYWPTTEFAFSRLQAFHNACRVSSISKTFNMDKWMANFLNRYDVSVQDRDLDLELADLGASNNGDELWEILFGGD